MMADMTGLPRAILLATDLSARCDRALHRARRLSRHWGVPLVALMVVEPAGLPDTRPARPRGRDAIAMAEARLRAEVLPVAPNAMILAEEGDPAEVIARVAAEHCCDLVVTGPAGNPTLAGFGLGSTVQSLLRISTVPVLIAKGSAHTDYRTILAATDLSAPSRHALETAARWFDGNLVAFNAYDLPFSGLVSDREAYDHETQRRVLAELNEFLAGSSLAAEKRRSLVAVAEQGAAPEIVQDYVDRFGIGLVTVASRGRSLAAELLLGSTATGIIARVTCDVLVVRQAGG